MSKPKLLPNTPLLAQVSQYDVDFVIPRVGVDLPLGIDPFLLFKSRDKTLSKIHSTLLTAFNTGLDFIRKGNLSYARDYFVYPEVPEIGLGYTKKGKRGSGVGIFLSELITTTLSDSTPLLERGIYHIEEMQLVSLGIGPDRVSDITANLIKNFLIEYTQRQCELWNIPMSKHVPVEHIFNYNNMSWIDGYFDLPRSPLDGTPILLVPRRIVRSLPWINYDDFFRMEFSAYLRAKHTKKILSEMHMSSENILSSKEKSEVVSITRTETARIDRYVARKEQTACEAQPSLTYMEPAKVRSQIEILSYRLSEMSTGYSTATAYQKLILEILNILFNPELIDGQIEVKTHDGTERRDIIFTNDSDLSFWSYLRSEHSSFLLMFETKNVDSLEPAHFNQTATYLGDRLGYLAFIVTRNAQSEANNKKAFSIYNDSRPRKIILILSDSDFQLMLQQKAAGNDPMRYIQRLYREFRTSVQ